MGVPFRDRPVGPDSVSLSVSDPMTMGALAKLAEATGVEAA
jgi:hypothetical protein